METLKLGVASIFLWLNLFNKNAGLTKIAFDPLRVFGFLLNKRFGVSMDIRSGRVILS